MTQQEFANIAKRLDEKTQKEIDKEIELRMNILKEGELSEEELNKMEECLYKSLIIQEYLDGEYELLDEEKEFLLEEMQELYDEYGVLLTKAKLEEKLSRKKRMALELLRIREQLMNRKEMLHRVKSEINKNRDNKEKLDKSTDKKTMKDLAITSKLGFDTDIKNLFKGSKETKNKETIKANENKTQEIKNEDKVNEKPILKDNTQKSNGKDRNYGGQKAKEKIVGIDNSIQNVMEIVLINDGKIEENHLENGFEKEKRI